MANLVYSKSSHGAKVFSGILLNVSDPNNPEGISLAHSARYFVEFISPSGKRIEKEGAVNQDGVIGTGDEMDIYYATAPDEALYEGETGYWKYRVGVEYANKVITTSPYWVGFWVVE